MARILSFDKLGTVIAVLLTLATSAAAQSLPIPASHTDNQSGAQHAPGSVSPFANGCTDCHGPFLGGGIAQSCFECHWDYNLSGGNARPKDWNIPIFNPDLSTHTKEKDKFWHAENKDIPFSDHCTDCHGPSLYGGIGPSCYQCHDDKWDNNDAGNLEPPLDHNVLKGTDAWHKPGFDDPFAGGCTLCHGPNLNDSFAPSCYSCHTEAAGTLHDFSGRSWLAPTDSACTPCHEFSIWNHAPAPASGYAVTGDTTADVGQPAGVSLKCLGCHEGSVAVDDYTGGPGSPSEFLTGNAAFGADLTQHHPVSFLYDTGLASNHVGLNDPATTASGLPGGGTIAADMLDAGQLECTACHDQHDDTFGKFLVMATDDQLCFTCHTKFLPGGTTGMHHIPLREDPWFRGQCTLCHGADLLGAGDAPACTSCHPPFSFPDPPVAPEHHGGDRHAPYQNCASCHGEDLTGAPFGPITAPSCYSCHGALWAQGNQPPVVDAGGPYVGSAGDAVVFDASGTIDPEGNTLSFTWDFGDGSPPQTAVQHSVMAYAFYAVGTYNGTLTVEDGFNNPVVVPFTVEIGEARSGPDVWTVTTTTVPPETFTITIEDHTGFLVITKDDGVNLPSVALGVEFTGVIFWMDVWMDLSGNVFWGTGDMFFGNISREGGTMSGVVFEDTGGVATFTGTKNP